MTSVVLDASVLAKWFKTQGERHVPQAAALRREYTNGTLVVIVPALVWLELLNAAGRRWRWPDADVLQLAAELERLAFDVVEPRLSDVATWVNAGLSAYDAAYVAVAGLVDFPLITDDERVAQVAGGLARPLAAPR